MENTTVKMPTKRTCFNRLASLSEVQADPELVWFVEHELELLDAKNGANRKPSEKELAKRAHDQELRVAMVDQMEVNTLYSASDLIKTLPCFASEPDIKPAKVSYLMQKLIEDGSVVRVQDKKRHILYKLAD